MITETAKRIYSTSHKIENNDQTLFVSPAKSNNALLNSFSGADLSNNEIENSPDVGDFDKMTFINDDGVEEENFHGKVVLNLENCDENCESNSMPLTALRLPTEENQNENSEKKELETPNDENVKISKEQIEHRIS